MLKNTKNLQKYTIKKLNQVLTSIAQGDSYRILHGKRMRWDRQIVSIPVTRNYRLLCLLVQGVLTPLRIVSHERYNHYCNGKRPLSKASSDTTLRWLRA